MHIIIGDLCTLIRQIKVKWRNVIRCSTLSTARLDQAVRPTIELF